MRNTDSFNFGFNVHKLSKEQTEAAIMLMEIEFSKEVPLKAKRSIRGSPDNFYT